MVEDLRSFLEILDREGELSRVKKPVSPRFELGRVAKAANGRAILFETIRGSKMRAISGVLGKRQSMALALRVSKNELLNEFMGAGSRLIAPRVVGRGPVNEVIETGKDVDLRNLPIATYCAKDAGPYITAGIVIAKDPESGVRNLSYNRMQLKGRSKLAIDITPPSGLDAIRAQAERSSMPIEVAVVIGSHPAVMIAAATRLPQGRDELGLAGALLKRPVPLVRCQTVDVEVPADTEIVLEGVIPPHIREPEGPFGEFTQYYEGTKDESIVKVKAIAHREDAIYQTIQSGSLEEHNLKSLGREEKIFRAAAVIGVRVQGVSLTPAPFICSISIEKRIDSEPEKVATTAFAADHSLRYCIVVDDDVDVHDQSDVLWAMATRSRPAKGVVVLPERPTTPSPIPSDSKMIIDSTVPKRLRGKFERARPPTDGKFKLKDYLVHL